MLSTCLLVGHCHWTVYCAHCCCLCGWYAIGGQRIYTAAMQHRKDLEKKNNPLPTCTKEFAAFEIKSRTLLLIQRQLAGLHEV